MSTENITTTIPANILAKIQSRIQTRLMSDDDWINTHASGTLRKNKRLGFAWKQQYLHERVCFEFGWCFESLPRSRVLTGVPMTEGDCHAVTEAGWHIDRYMALCNVLDDDIQVKYLNVEDAEGTVREGIGMILTPTMDIPWLPQGHVVFALVAEFDKASGDWKPAENPC